MNQSREGDKDVKDASAVDGEVVGRDRDKPVVDEFRANGGVLGGRFAGRPVLLLHAKGAKSGLIRITPVMYSKEGDRFVIAASLAGAPKNPAWYYNLLANPVAEIEVATERFRVRAQVVDEPERTRLFQQLKLAWPHFAEYETKTTRVIPVVVLTRVK